MRTAVRVGMADGAGAIDITEVGRSRVPMRDSYEMAGPSMEDLDPYEWGATSPNPQVSDPEELVLPFAASAAPRSRSAW
jgi:hypothetical protein